MSIPTAISPITPERSERGFTMIAGSAIPARPHSISVESIDRDRSQSENAQSVLVSLNQHASQFLSLSGSLQEELDRLKALLAEKDRQIACSATTIRQNG